MQAYVPACHLSGTLQGDRWHRFCIIYGINAKISAISLLVALSGRNKGAEDGYSIPQPQSRYGRFFSDFSGKGKYDASSR